MKRWQKISLVVLVVVAAVAIVIGSVVHSRSGVVTVQTSRAQKQTVTAIVTASGEIKPKTYADISANSLGRVTDLLVKEGDHVHRGQLLARLENVQQGADVEAMRAAVRTSEADVQAQEAAIVTDQADVQRTAALLVQAKQDWQRAQGLFADKLIAKQDYDAKRAAYESAAAQHDVAVAKLNEARAQLATSQTRIAQSKANLLRASDVLSKTEFVSPLNGLVTYLPVHVGETVVMGIQNQPGSLVMRVADMSVVTAELKVDETDIVNVKLGQPVTVLIDAYGDRKINGKVTEVGDTAILRSTGQAATTNTSTEEAKDFKVVVTLTDPPDDIKPGLSCTAKITTGVAKDVVSVPIQAVVERSPDELKEPKPGTAEASGPSPTATSSDEAKQPLQGVFVIRNKRAEFVQVKTGVNGVDRIEVKNGLQPGDEVVTGPYKELRTMRNNSRVKIDNTTVKKPEETTS